MSELIPVVRVKVVFDKVWGEWIVKCWGRGGRRLKAADYFSGSRDRADADATAAMIMRGKSGVAEGGAS
jgi:hypothetical protein